MQANVLDRFAVFSIPPKIVVLVYNRCTLGSRTIVIGYICFLLQCCPTFGIFLEHLNGYPNQALRHVIVFNWSIMKKVFFYFYLFPEILFSTKALLDAFDLFNSIKVHQCFTIFIFPFWPWPKSQRKCNVFVTLFQYNSVSVVLYLVKLSSYIYLYF